MSMIEGAELAETKKLKKPLRVLNEILRNVRLAYAKAGIIHADLSEYNIIVKPDEHILIIDWPQYVTKDHPNAAELLKRDVNNVLTYFRRKFGIQKETEKVIRFVEARVRASNRPKGANKETQR